MEEEEKEMNHFALPNYFFTRRPWGKIIKQ
jgi:hypothetical protein